MKMMYKRLKHVRIAAGVQWTVATTHRLAQIQGLGRILDGIWKVIGKLIDDVIIVVRNWHSLDVAKKVWKKRLEVEKKSQNFYFWSVSNFSRGMNFLKCKKKIVIIKSEFLMNFS